MQDVQNKGTLVWARVCVGTLYFPFHFSVNLKMLKKKKKESLNLETNNKCILEEMLSFLLLSACYYSFSGRHVLTNRLER